MIKDIPANLARSMAQAQRGGRQELVNIFGLTMRFGITASQVRENIYAYPTFSSDIKHMLGHG
jgi:pyruvate/2-oxoglutarate dehydrogenase complex dihydrolipoamide dehydrogenase (E3) component